MEVLGQHADVNLQTLDALVHEYLQQEELVEDQRLLFRLKKQKFIEILRSQQPECDRAALACAKLELVPLALNAYPEAYLEFKKLLLLLVYTNGASPHSVGQEWSPSVKQQLAAIVYHTLRHETGVQDPSLSLLLRYLLYLHATLRAHSPEPLLESALVDRLLRPTRDAAPLPLEIPGCFREADVQAIITGAGVPRQAAVEALKRCHGDIAAAFRSELMRMQLNTSLLDQLVLEYASYRGLLEVPAESLSTPDQSECAAGGAVGRQAMDVDATQPAAAADTPMDAASPRAGQWLQGPFAHPAHSPTPIQPQTNGQSPSPQPLNGQHHASPAAGGWQPTSTGGFAVPWPGAGPHPMNGMQERTDVHSTFPREASHSPPCKIPRWRGRQSSGLGTPEDKASVSQDWPWVSADGADEDCQPMAMCGQQYSAVLGLPRLVQAGSWQQLHDVVVGLDPGLFEERPELLFEVERCKYLQLVEQGDVTTALQLARSVLAPIAERHPHLLPVLRSTMATLLPGSCPDSARPDMAALTLNLQAALQARLGLQGPRLVRLVHALLSAHRTWFKLQRCSDPFAADLKVDLLRVPGASSHTVASPPAPAMGTQTEAAADKASSEAEPPLVSSSEDEDVLDEEAILQLVEFLNCPRSRAIELLLQNEGNVEAAIHQAFGA